MKGTSRPTPSRRVASPRGTACHRIRRPLLALLIAAALTHGCGDSSGGGGAIQQGTQIELTDGVVQGHVDGAARRFLGLPFARPPVGELRWAPPQPPASWQDVLDASRMSAPCAQLGSLTAPPSDNEDCLYLNVWSPDPAPDRPLPVMVWFHGGSNTGGAASAEAAFGVGGLLYDGRTLAETRDVVVVTTNYRLNVFGFFSHEALAAEDPNYPYAGNQGLLDQRAALAWVRDNIAAFGGDPGNVTIFGESAGAFDVCFHVASPMSHGLFHRAISQSGGCTTRQRTDAEGRERAAALVTSVGCAGAADPLACLRDVPVADLLAQAAGFGPTVDGGFVPDQPRALFDRGEIAPVPYILGSNSDEGTLFFLGAVVVETEAEYLTELERRFGERAPEVAAAYPASAFASPNDALVRAFGDQILVCSTWDSARRAAAAGRDVYLYNFARPILTDALPFLGATHGAEIAFVFGSAGPASPEDEVIGQAMRGYWTRFARTGDPNGEDALAWPLYDDTTDRRVEFDRELRVLSGFRRNECELWWSFYDAAFAPGATATPVAELRAGAGATTARSGNRE